MFIIFRPILRSDVNLFWIFSFTAFEKKNKSTMYFYFLLKLPSLHLPIHPSNSLLVFLSHYIFVIRLSVCMSFSLYGVMSVWRFLCLSVFLSVRISVCQFVCLSAWLTLGLSGFQYGCLSIDLCTRLCFGVSLLKFMKVALCLLVIVNVSTF